MSLWHCFDDIAKMFICVCVCVCILLNLSIWATKSTGKLQNWQQAIVLCVCVSVCEKQFPTKSNVKCVNLILAWNSLVITQKAWMRFNMALCQCVPTLTYQLVALEALGPPHLKPFHSRVEVECSLFLVSLVFFSSFFLEFQFIKLLVHLSQMPVLISLTV